jgi:glycerol-3-phosphate acyltransferase PlsY
MINNIVIAPVIGYLLGSFPSAHLAGRLRQGMDIRDVGSRNMGATNVFYHVGPAEGVPVTLADLGKGIVAILLVRWLSDIPLIVPFDFVTGLTATAAIIGYIFPIFLKFRGGKGGAPSIGILLFLMHWAVPFLLVVFAIAFFITRHQIFSYSLLLIVLSFIAWRIYFDYHGEDSIFFSIGVGVFTGIHYISRFKEMYSKPTYDWRKVVKPYSLKERYQYVSQ